MHLVSEFWDGEFGRKQNLQKPASIYFFKQKVKQMHIVNKYSLKTSNELRDMIKISLSFWF